MSTLWEKASPSGRSPVISAKTLPPFPTRSLKTESQIPGTRAVLIIHTTFASIGSAAEKPMPVRGYSSVTPPAAPTESATGPAMILNRNNASGLIRPPTSATAVKSPETNAPSPPSVITMPSLPPDVYGTPYVSLGGYLPHTQGTSRHRCHRKAPGESPFRIPSMVGLNIP